ncbi:hypothetical protein BCF46_3875 [Litoreibacter meonggei]|uniref:Uncharacterized protein n=1 Tax=Litoreibacter meonggei TaxID=1049199 RepID=A0A497V6N7_9RHOB|nr:hypothetical protein BCF46_3875 [Litoreibacter meonggei]
MEFRNLVVGQALQARTICLGIHEYQTKSACAAHHLGSC